jgi:hypothetical protein
LFVVEHLQRFRELQDAVIRGELIECAFRRSFAAGAVVAADINNERVVEFTLVLDFLDYSADLIVCLCGIGGEDLRLAGVEFFLDVCQRVPSW